ncbi:DUF5060 domain-containing protein [Sphingomonas floccifaciens]|uniref:DUF5060 domain-containing protein n=1 Tax=Sphingomonas floccifaciens TaxID=1844115 RepID=A0ABW4N932_9SPHN
MTVTRRTMLGAAVAGGVVAMVPGGAVATALAKSVERWGLYEIALDGPSGGNPFDDVRLTATFESGGRTIAVPGFYDGDGTYRIRFSPGDLGRWTWRTASNVAALDGKTGTMTCVAPAAGNRGPVRMSRDGYHFVYADGTPYRPVGTTSYSWALQSDARCAETLATLKTAPFNKIRMCVFPNVASVATDPFVRTGAGPKDWDPARFDPAYFRRFEDRIRRLGALGIEADVILFHPYDKLRGYSDMKPADDARYLRYIAARFGAFRNVWWAMANEYDLVETKTVADWDRLFQTLVAADPHDRLRSIHNLHVYYDQRKPWITHASIQNGAAVLDDGRVHPHRQFAQKAVIFDEVIYEGNSSKRWAALTGEQLVERFWWGTIGGCYVGHGEVLSAGDNPDVSWLGQGGKLNGTSPARIAFLRKILEDGPLPGIDPIQQFWDYHLGGRDFTYYLKYFGRDTPTEWKVRLPTKAADPHNSFRIDVIDTWNMTVTPVDGVFTMQQLNEYDVHDPARPTVALPGRPYMALRIVKV